MSYQGAGKAFSAGGDLAWLLERHRDTAENNIRVMQVMVKSGSTYVSSTNLPTLWEQILPLGVLQKVPCDAQSTCACDCRNQWTCSELKILIMVQPALCWCRLTTLSGQHFGEHIDVKVNYSSFRLEQVFALQWEEQISELPHLQPGFYGSNVQFVTIQATSFWIQSLGWGWLSPSWVCTLAWLQLTFFLLLWDRRWKASIKAPAHPVKALLFVMSWQCLKGFKVFFYILLFLWNTIMSLCFMIKSFRVRSLCLFHPILVISFSDCYSRFIP